MIHINRIKHKTEFVIFSVILAVAAVIAVCSLGMSNDSEKLTSSASYSIENRWLDDSGKITDLNTLSLTQGEVYHLSFEDGVSPNSKLIFKTENMGTSAYINGKMLYRHSAEFGKRYEVISLDEVNKDTVVYLHFTPSEHLTGHILSPIKVTTQNDFLFSLIKENSAVLLLLSVIFLTAVSLSLFVLIKAITSNRKYLRLLYLSLFLLLLFFAILSSSDVMQFVLGSSVMIYLIRYACLMMLTVPAVLYLSVCEKIKSRSVDLLQLLICFYSVLRLILFALFHIPPERGIAVSYCLSAVNVLLMIALPLYQKIKTYRLQ